MANPFELFNLPVQFEIDSAQLSERYLALQKSLHPDNFSASSSTEQRLAMQKSAEVNDALHILKDPILRAESIIQIHTGENRDIEQKSQRDMAFLMQQLEWRETLENIESAKNETKLTAFTQEIELEQKKIIEQLTNLLAQQQWENALIVSDKLRFIKKLLVEIERVEENLFDF
ncbi:Fe-S protein assembly co-chaperone HscB [Ursidibacter maritimus]|uniref:Co-chaperone protein HscB homolog n=1 Tax=Ursidibacter maritimus TaxID=1331689 RepID=A0A949WMN2_9PAST|nr:Fe-S protein assembly co-chaperone HscB [Ursidibacter maritimus]KAE9539025.1 co-chaperone HscB [Ursidibacter maritimus]MBV6523765.1 Fe-S protein assembly co-chaperone HscB [Ursidibacter maritimus]MBV6526620.1 Fe-S protein assembly co-chaperone HscB [Ursidibacter maritimus]MBV6527959.1 Fe-S protein assembly co-chaperone HscB [Ursidibacter maritimus]MBV6528898.1 Fe-S protein assembly co-chaperone HscB [Ursidibacter maritimus]